MIWPDRVWEQGVDDKWSSREPTEADKLRRSGINEGLRIQRNYQPRDWIAELDKLPDSLRNHAEDYLRSIASRMRAQRQVKRGHHFEEEA